MSFQNKFNESARIYDMHANIQRDVSKEMVDFYVNYNKNLPKKILDIGCGTGFNIENLKVFYSNCHYTALDISRNMLDIARRKFGDNRMTYIHHDAQSFDFQGLMFDACISNMCFQWIDDLEFFLDKLKKHTNRIIFSTLLSGSFREFYELFDKIEPFSSSNKFYKNTDQMQEICRKISANVRYFELEKIIIKSSAIDAARYFKNIGASIHSDNFYKNLNILRKNRDKIELKYKIFIGDIIL